MQRSLDELGVPLAEVTFCVIDLETTGASSVTCGITEIGAVKVRGGECLGTLQTLVNPSQTIPPEITVLTGITERMVLRAPPVAAVLPTLLEFMGDAVIVGHNVRFDLRFLAAALLGARHPPPSNRWVDTCALARRLVRDEVPNCRLHTLAERFRLSHQPSHRALDDALATTDLLHLLLERAATWGVLGLDDLLELPTLRGHPQTGKLSLTARLPRRPGVYLFRDTGGRVLYVGKATDLRGRVRSYFSGDDRRKVDQLLRELVTIDHIVCSGPLEAAVMEVRLIHHYLPRFNRRAKRWRRYAYLKLTLDERFPRLSVVRVPRRDDGCLYLGPLPSQGAARRVAEAIESAAPLRRCTKRPSRTLLPAPCAPAQLSVSTCPCSGSVSEAEYTAIVRRVVRGLTHDPSVLLEPLAARMQALALAERFEEAAATRDRAAALARAITRQRRLDRLARTGRLVVEVPGQGGALLVRGRLAKAWRGEGPGDDGRGHDLPGDDGPGGGPPLPNDDIEPSAASGRGVGPGPVSREIADELACVAAWLDREADRLRLLRCEGELTSVLPAVPSFEPGQAGRGGRSTVSR